MAIGSLHELVVDCANPIALARFWQALIGGEVDVEADDWVVLDGDDEGFFIAFNGALDGATGRSRATSRIRLEVEVDDLDRAVDEAEQLGARKVGGPVDRDDGLVQTMADPEGNEFAFVS